MSGKKRRSTKVRAAAAAEEATEEETGVADAKTSVADEDGDGQIEPRQKRARVSFDEAAAAAAAPAPAPAVDPEDDEDDGSVDGDIGPMPAPPSTSDEKVKKKKRVLPHEALFLANLPSSDQYERSLMHRDVVNFVEVAHRTDFVITTSVDGHVKFWKKTSKGIEFVKHFRAHLGPIVAVSTSHDGTLFASSGADKAIKIFDIVNFDMINMLKIDYLPNAITWCFKRGDAQALLACSDLDSPAIHLYDGRDVSSSGTGAPGKDSTTPLAIASSIHPSPVHIMRYHPDNYVISVDTSGMMECWVPDADAAFPAPSPPAVAWSFKAETHLYEFKKSGPDSVPTSLSISPRGDRFVTFGFGDRKVRVWNARTAKVIRVYDESVSATSSAASADLDSMEFGRRVAGEREIEKRSGQSATANAVFDDTGNFVIYPTFLGIKIVNVETNKVARLLGKTENHRFVNVALYQGAPKKKGLITHAMAASDNAVIKESEATDPTIFCTAFKRNRFFMFTKRGPDAEENDGQSRDIFNEKPSREEQTVATTLAQSTRSTRTATDAVIHTSKGDITVRLFPEHAPRAVENFVGLARKGYYDSVLFHRVIRGFMIQTGDPLGDGTGGESLWGHDFEDEFSRVVKHDRPYTLSMANCGPNTNASQFFITTVPTPWLDNKHTVFGRATAGMDVIHLIEAAKTDKGEKPLEDIRILGVEVS